MLNPTDLPSRRFPDDLASVTGQVRTHDRLLAQMPPDRRCIVARGKPVPNDLDGVGVCLHRQCPSPVSSRLSVRDGRTDGGSTGRAD